MERQQPATPADQDAVAALLRACGLPWQDIAAHLPHFTIALDGAQLVGVIGLEVHGKEGLLRSLAVAPERRGEGIARRLYAAAIAQARRLGLERLYVLTTSAQGFFALLGFQALQREQVPDSIRATEEFSALCPAEATCLARVVPRASLGDRAGGSAVPHAPRPAADGAIRRAGRAICRARQMVAS